MILVGVAACCHGHEGDALLVSSFLAVAYIYLDTILGCLLQVLARTRLVIVVDDIDLTSAGTAIASALGIVHHAVAEIHILSLHWVLPLVGLVIIVAGISCPTISGTAESRTTVHHVGDEVVVEAG